MAKQLFSAKIGGSLNFIKYKIEANIKIKYRDKNIENISKLIEKESQSEV